MKTLDDVAIKEPFQIYCCIQMEMKRLETINQTIATSDPRNTRQMESLTEWQRETRADLKRLLTDYYGKGYKALSDRDKLIALGVDI